MQELNLLGGHVGNFLDAMRESIVGLQIGDLLRKVTLNRLLRNRARIEALGIPKVLCADLALFPDDAGIGLAGSGLMLVNPPYGADDFLRQAYAAIYEILASPGAGYVEVARLTPERVTSR